MNDTFLSSRLLWYICVSVAWDEPISSGQRRGQGMSRSIRPHCDNHSQVRAHMYGSVRRCSVRPSKFRNEVSFIACPLKPYNCWFEGSADYPYPGRAAGFLIAPRKNQPIQKWNVRTEIILPARIIYDQKLWLSLNGQGQITTTERPDRGSLIPV